MRHYVFSLLGALLIGVLLPLEAQAEVLDGDLRRRGSGKYELRFQGRSYSVEGQVPLDLRIVGEGRVRVDVLRGATTLMVRRMVLPRLEPLDLDVLPRSEGESWRARVGDRTYTLAGRTSLLQRLGSQGRVTVQGYRQPHDQRIVVRTVRAETTGVSLTRVARYIPVPPPIRFTVPRGLIRKGREIWLTHADDSFVTFRTRSGKERLLKRDKISVAPRAQRAGIVSGLSK